MFEKLTFYSIKSEFKQKAFCLNFKEPVGEKRKKKKKLNAYLVSSTLGEYILYPILRI